MRNGVPVHSFNFDKIIGILIFKYKLIAGKMCRFCQHFAESNGFLALYHPLCVVSAIIVSRVCVVSAYMEK